MGRMRYIEVDGKRASVLGFGCGGVLGRVGRRDSLRAMGAAWDAGVTMFDTARSYGYGEAEGLLGEFLQGRREGAVVVTKFGIWPEAIPGWKRRARPLVRAVLGLLPGTSARGALHDAVRRAGVRGTSSAGHFDVTTLRRSLEESLRQLRTGYVDVLLMHEATAEAVRDEDLVAELAGLVRVGKVRRVGVSLAAGLPESAVPAWVGALQAPVRAFEMRPEPMGERSAARFFMGNHPFGGAERSQAALRALGEVRRGLAPTLREKLAGDPREALAQAVLGAAFASGVDAVVPSMLHEKTVRANVAAVAGAEFSLEELRVLRGWVRSAGE